MSSRVSTEEENADDLIAKSCTFREHFDEMRGLAADVKELKVLYQAASMNISTLNLSLGKLDSDINTLLRTLNDNIANGVLIVRSFTRLWKLVVFTFLVCIVGLITQITSINFDLWGLKIQTRDVSKELTVRSQ